MSKPLVFVLQIIALVLIVKGFISEPTNVTLIIFGIVLALVAGIGIRKRLKQG